MRREFFFFQAEDGIRDYKVTGVQTCALPIFRPHARQPRHRAVADAPVTGRLRHEHAAVPRLSVAGARQHEGRSEEHTSELQSPCNLVCRLLLEKKKKQPTDAVSTRRRYK